MFLSKPETIGLSEAVDALRQWQLDDSSIQLHAGDLGWLWRFGTAAVTTAVRTWSRNGQTLAVALLDGPDLARVTPRLRLGETKSWHSSSPRT